MDYVTEREVYRGAMAQLQTSFFDSCDDRVTPSAAFVRVDYPALGGGRATVCLDMVPPCGYSPWWTGDVDTRGMGLGALYYSIHTGTPVPVSVEDGAFMVVGGPANLINFPASRSAWSSGFSSGFGASRC